MKYTLPFLFILLCLASAGCTSLSGAGNATPVTATPPGTHAFVINESIRPGDDFYSYVNDAWLRENPIPSDKKRWGSFDVLQDTVNADLHALLMNASTASPGTADRNITLIGQFYRSGMDNATIEQDGLTSLSGDLGMIDAIRSRADLTNATILLLQNGSGTLYSYSAEVNPRNSTEMIGGFGQGGIGLPDRDYYLRTDNTSLSIQQEYKRHVTRVLGLAGENATQAAADAETIYAMEKNFALSHFTSEENQDPEKTTNLYTPAQLKEQYPAIGWERLFIIPGSGPVNRVDIWQPSFVKELNSQLQAAPLDDWKAYLRYRVIDGASPYLNSSFEEEHFAFYSTTLNGVGVMQSRWKRVVDTENGYLGDLVGQAYVAEYVDPRTRGMVTDMFRNLRSTFDQRIANLTWMSNTTKNAAREKLAAMGQKIAYPDTWQDYSGLNLTDSYAGNVRAAAAYNLVHGPSGLENIGVTVNGNLTLGENIADFGGLTLACHAWEATANQTPSVSSGNTTANREFFYSAARIWRQNIREEALRNQVYTDPHSPGRYRVNGVVFNIPEFYEAFPEIRPGDSLYRNASDRPVIW